MAIVSAGKVELGAEHSHARPRSPRTDGISSRSNGRVGSKAVCIAAHSPVRRELLLRGFSAPCDAHPRRVPEVKTPDQAVAERLGARRKLARCKRERHAGPDDVAEAHPGDGATQGIQRADS